jgi:hypothetical protein
MMKNFNKILSVLLLACLSFGATSFAMQGDNSKSLVQSQFHEQTAITCPICCDCAELESPEDALIVTTPCKHTFHNSCLLQWLSKQNSCPICRTPLKQTRFKLPSYETIDNACHNLATACFAFVIAGCTYVAIFGDPEN